jgi:hypothetical protein
MRTFGTDRLTDGLTDGAGYIGPADRQGGSNKSTNEWTHEIKITINQIKLSTKVYKSRYVPKT